ncbi:N-6 DNA methylase [Aeromicrobium sp. A1-2]|uniref:N-6 DNA methylase n=1 Tax=Aeromicrobium sp. A1-2 TaxID=2107713 RepID=UPI0013C2CDEC|nr:N-6 DNA methylase [Aeromicrobium sp. A1-2]
MRPHQGDIICALYEASSDDGGALRADFDQWAHEVAAVRGELDRKKKVPPAQLKSVLGAVDEPDLSRFVYSVERYMLARAYRLIVCCVGGDDPLDHAAPPVVEKAAPIVREIDALLDRLVPGAQKAEALEIAALLSEDGPFADLFQSEFMHLVPRQVRHAIGSYYTPQWLARHVIRSAGYRCEDAESLRKSIIDPACGSGVFLVAAAEEIRQAVVAGSIDSHEAIHIIDTKIHGIDVELVPCLLTIASLTFASSRLRREGRVTPPTIPRGISHADSLEEREGATRVDLVVGNPPWVNWEYMPAEYRKKHSALWPALGIFGATGRVMGYSKEDISALFVAHAIHFRLAGDGSFGFVLPESLLKSASNHRDFRRFELGQLKEPFQVSLVEDFVEAKPFEGVSNRTIVILGQNGLRTAFPVPFRKWGKLDRMLQPTTGSGALNGPVSEGMAQLASADDASSSWSTGAAAGMEVHRRLDGANAYKARTGLFTGGANAVFHLRLNGRREDGLLKVENVVERARRVVPQVEAVIEPRHVYPFLRGRDVSQWRSQAELAVLLPHTADSKMAAVSISDLRESAPRTLAYLEQFRGILGERKGFSAWEEKYRATDFYACQRVGEYTFADWKVVWRYIAKVFTTAVVGPVTIDANCAPQPAIPNEKLMLIACSSPEEAYYVGGVLAGSVVVEHVHSRMVSTQISPSIVAKIGVPRWDPSSSVHRQISEVCAEGHRRVAAEDDVTSLLDELDDLVASLWDVSSAEARAARQRLG